MLLQRKDFVAVIDKILDFETRILIVKIQIEEVLMSRYDVGF